MSGVRSTCTVRSHQYAECVGGPEKRYKEGIMMRPDQEHDEHDGAAVE